MRRACLRSSWRDKPYGFGREAWLSILLRCVNVRCLRVTGKVTRDARIGVYVDIGAEKAVNMLKRRSSSYGFSLRASGADICYPGNVHFACKSEALLQRRHLRVSSEVHCYARRQSCLFVLVLHKTASSVLLHSPSPASSRQLDRSLCFPDPWSRRLSCEVCGF